MKQVSLNIVSSMQSWNRWEKHTYTHSQMPDKGEAGEEKEIVDGSKNEGQEEL